ncbi:VOC family protein [Kribbella sp. NPDC000426]|uniref:VOC family protein n=1 Tax=Kribbella sp. NPDC000426 TaxID=3154255 RepID=UPI00332572C7
MITNVSLVTVYVDDIDEAKAFYTEKLGFELGEDITLSEDFRWCTVHQADHPELELALMLPGPPMDEESAGWIREPADRPYGVEAVLRDNSGNWPVLVEQKAYTAADFA